MGLYDLGFTGSPMLPKKEALRAKVSRFEFRVQSLAQLDRSVFGLKKGLEILIAENHMKKNMELG